MKNTYEEHIKPCLSKCEYMYQSTPHNRVTLVPEHFDPIKRSELILFLWFCSWPSDPITGEAIKQSRLYISITDRLEEFYSQKYCFLKN